MTNLERLQQETAEEVAETFTQFWHDGHRFICPTISYIGEGQCAINSDCRECFLEWLKSERAKK